MSAPEKVFRIGLISASVFVNEVDGDNGKRELRNVSLQRRYRDGDGEWKSSATFTLADLPAARRAMEIAQTYVESVEADVSR